MAERVKPESAQYFVYIVQAADGRYYIGYTTDLERRLDQHQRGAGAKFTRGFGCSRLLYHEIFSTKSAAMKREAALKQFTRAEKTALITNSTSD